MRYAMHSSWHQFEPPPTPEIDAITFLFGGKRHNKDLNTSGYMTIAESATAKREKEIAEAVHRCGRSIDIRTTTLLSMFIAVTRKAVSHNG